MMRIKPVAPGDDESARIPHARSHGLFTPIRLARPASRPRPAPVIMNVPTVVLPPLLKWVSGNAAGRASAAYQAAVARTATAGTSP